MMIPVENDPRRAGTIWMLDLDEQLPEILPSIPATFSRIDAGFLPVSASMLENDVSAEWRRRFETGRRCYAASIGDQLVSYGWVSLEEEHIGELNLRIRLLPGEAYIWDCATVPAFRRKHLYSALLHYVISQLHTEEFCRAWIGADMDNLPSQQGMARAGFHHVADLVVARVLAIPQVWVQGLPGAPEHLVAEARRAFLSDRDKVWKSAATLAAQPRSL